MVQIQLQPELEDMVRTAAAAKHVSETFFIEQVLERWFEDREDYKRGIQALASMKYTISQEEMDRRAEGVESSPDVDG